MTGESLVDGITLHGGDCLEVLAALPPASFDACCTDPPYHFTSIIKRWSKSGTEDRTAAGAMGRHSRGFMGQTWDGGDIAFRPETWAAVRRVLKPGAHLVAFAAPKNEHRLTCAIEDAGFEIRDKLLWLFGVGFPKSHDAKQAMGKADDVDLFREHLERAADKWQGWGTGLKPAYEPIVLARAPLSGTVQENLREHGTGALNIDACRVHGPDVADAVPYTVKRLNPRASVNATGEWKQDRIYEGETKPGRWPANLLHDGSDEVVSMFPAQAGAIAPVHKRGGDKFRNTYGAFAGDIDEAGSTFCGDSGSAARFFYGSKATKGERAGSKHPTVKPISPLRYFIRMIAPPGATIIDPFAGTGTTGQAALMEGCRAVLIEREAQYQTDIRTRFSPQLSSPKTGALPDQRIG